jgi:putative NADH-flavin reductase
MRSNLPIISIGSMLVIVTTRWASVNIAVIAANGRSGQAFVEAALAAGHTVRGGVLGKNFLQPHPRLTVVSCDATKEDDLKALLTGQDAAVSLIGHVRGSPPAVQTVAIQKIVSVMEELGIRRLVSLTGTGVRLPGDKITLLDRLLNLAVTFVDPARVKDGRSHVEVLKHSKLDWTVIRVLKLQDVPPAPFSLTEHGPTKPYVGRAEVAQAILRVLGNNDFIRQAPIISKAGGHDKEDY